jgi:putative tricarboxylic transport membrane protein
MARTPTEEWPIMLAIIFYLVCLLGTVGLFIETYNFPLFDFGITGPATFPRIVIILTLALTVILLVKSLIARKKIDPAILPNARQIILMSVIVTYIILLQYIGFIISSLLFVLSTTMYLSDNISTKELAIGGAISLASVFGIYLIFEVWLLVFLP